MEFPVDGVIPQLSEALQAWPRRHAGGRAGRGQDHAGAFEAAGQPWLGQRKIVMLEPRRLAARAAAKRMAETLGEAMGETVGYTVQARPQGLGPDPHRSGHRRHSHPAPAERS